MPGTPVNSLPDPQTDPSPRPDLGPSDSSDSASDLPQDLVHTDSDAQGTGDRESANPRDRDHEGADIGADRVTDADHAGVSRKPPDPVRNGGQGLAIVNRKAPSAMDAIERIAAYMHEHALTLVTAESCTAGLIAATLADVAGAGSLLDCAFVVYSPQAKMRCLGMTPATLARHNLTSEPVAREMALGASRQSPALIAISNTGVTDSVDDDIPAGTQCYAWVFKAGQADAAPAIYAETRRFSGNRNGIRLASARYALQRLVEYHAELTGKPKPR